MTRDIVDSVRTPIRCASAFAAVVGFIVSPWTLILAAVTAFLYQTGLLDKAFTGLRAVWPASWKA